MHIFFSGIGGTGIGPLALIAKQANYEVSGSDKQESQYIEYLKQIGVKGITIGQTREQIAKIHASNPIDWFVYSSALPKENPNHPELVFCQQNGIKMTKRDELLNSIIKEKQLKLLAVAGTHGKTTTTAMLIWLLKQLEIPLSYSVGAKISFGDMGHYQPGSQYFAYECDEFDRNFLAFHPYLSLITGVAWDHHEIFPTKDDYRQAFRQFLDQSEWKILWQADNNYLGSAPNENYLVLDEKDETIENIGLAGLYNRRDAWLVSQSVHKLTDEPLNKLCALMAKFPGVSRRFEQIAHNLYSDYAHTPEKIIGAMSVALETAKKNNQDVVVVYEPLTNRRMHFMKDQHQGIFSGARSLYWVPSYLAREDPDQAVLTPTELISYLDEPTKNIAKPMELDEELKQTLNRHIENNDLVLCLSGGGGGSLDEWLRANFASQH